jgi:hypothetical protein
MGKILVSLLLGTALMILGMLFFGGGPITGFYTIVDIITNPAHVRALATGGADATADVNVVIAFIMSVGGYYLLSAVIVFILDLFMPKPRPKK